MRIGISAINQKIQETPIIVAASQIWIMQVINESDDEGPH